MHKKKIGLALSGGGYRAAAFHLGVLRKLHQLKILHKIDVISTISGGSIIGAFYMLHFNGNMDAFESLMREKLKTSSINLILRNPIFIFALATFIALPIAVFWATKIVLAPILTMAIELLLLIGLQFTLLPITSFKIKAYEDIFFGKKTLKDLIANHRIAINATNLETGTLFTFSKQRMGDSSYSHPRDRGNAIGFLHDSYPISHAVASSTAVPFGFNPVKIEQKFFKNPDDYFRVNPSLVDGGVYDNQGIHKLTQNNSGYQCDIVICSDGSMPFKYRFRGFNSFMVLYRSTDLMMNKIKNLQFIRDVYNSNREVAYFSLNWEYEKVFDEVVNSIKDGTLKPLLMAYYNLPIAWTANAASVKANESAIKLHLKKLIGFESMGPFLDSDEHTKICEIGTNLTALSDEEITLLATHASALVEIHVKLFCPNL